MRLTAGNEQVVASSRSLPKLLSASLVVGALLLVFVVDRRTGATPVQHLYYLPIILAGVRFRMPGGIIAALSAIVLYHLANPHLLTFRYEESDLVPIVLFLVTGVITAKLATDADRLRHLAMTDDLTGLHNLRSFEARLAVMVRAARESREPLALLVLDVDRLKSLNDKHGHLTGAEAVRTVGHVVGQRLPPDAIACRYGGDEFVIAMARCTPSVVNRVAESLCRAVHATAPVLAGHRFAAGTLSISVGGSCTSFRHTDPWRPVLLRDTETGESLFRAADAALYRAKARGRNQVCVLCGDVENGAFEQTGPVHSPHL